MSSNISPMDNLSITNDLYSTYESDSSCSSNKNHFESSINSKDSTTIKLPYPVLSDHRDSSLILILLQKETQGTSKKIFDVIKQIDDCEKRLNSLIISDKIRTNLKYQRIQRKQQLDALKKHERRVNLQIDYITTKTEIKGLDDEQQIINDKNSDEYKQIEMLTKKLKQKLDQMKMYMKKRNDQIKKPTSSSQKPADLNRKRSSSSIASTSHSNKHFKPTVPHHHHNTKPSSPVVRLASRFSKSHPIQTPTVRFLNKTTTDSIINSSSPTTPASSSSTLSPPLIASTSTEEINNNNNNNNTSHSLPIIKTSSSSILEDGEIDVEFDIDELFNEDSHSQTKS